MNTVNTDKIRDLAQQIIAELDSPAPPPAPPTRTIFVPLMMGLQAAVDAAQPGDEIRLAPLSVGYDGPILLRRKPSGDDEITIRPDVRDSELPPTSVRVDNPNAFTPYNTAFAVIRPRVNEYGILCEPGAANYRLLGLKILSPGLGGTCIGIGDWDPMPSTIEQQPHHITIDRCWCDGQLAAKRGIAANGHDLIIINSIVDNVVKAGQDAQAIAITQGSTILISANYLRASGETVIIGGDDPKIPNYVPSDISVLYNTIGKDPMWQTMFAGDYKNCFELKNARRVKVRYNVIEHCWADSQDGTAVLFTVRNQGGHAPWSTIEDVEFAFNIIRHCASAISILGHDDEAISKGVSGTLTNLHIHDNLGYDIGRKELATKLTGERDVTFAFSLNNGPVNVTIEHNTMLGVYSTLMKLSPGKQSTPCVNLQVRANVFSEGKYSIAADSLAPGTPSWSFSVVDAQSKFDGNVLARTAVNDNYKYPSTNFKSAVAEPVVDDTFHVLPKFAALAATAGIADFGQLPAVPFP